MCYVLLCVTLVTYTVVQVGTGRFVLHVLSIKHCAFFPLSLGNKFSQLRSRGSLGNHPHFPWDGRGSAQQFSQDEEKNSFTTH